jgi:hypothetical protein
VKIAPVLAAAIAAAAGVALLAARTIAPSRTDAAATMPSAGAVAMAAPPAVGSAVHRAAAADPTAIPSTPNRDLLLPDGTTVPTLNDAVDAEPLATYWGPFPWSPIVGVERNDQGLDWYRHADGSYSTTQMVWRQDLGRHAAMTRVAHPGPTPPAVAGSR